MNKQTPQNDLKVNEIDEKHAETVTYDKTPEGGTLLENTLENGVSEVHVAVEGDVVGSALDGTPYEQHFTKDALEAIAREQTAEILVDKEHSSEKDGSTEAMGWLSDLEYKEGKGLFGKIKWTDIGRKLVENRVFRFLSPAWIVDRLTKKPIAMTSCALTNRPSQAVNGIEPIINSVKTISGVKDERQCAACKAWDGKEVTYGGRRVKGISSYEHAKGQGLHHPGCRCTLNEEFQEITKDYTDMDIQELKDAIKAEIKAELVAEVAAEPAVNEATDAEKKENVEAVEPTVEPEAEEKVEEAAEEVTNDEAVEEKVEEKVEETPVSSETEKPVSDEPETPVSKETEVIDVKTLNSLPKVAFKPEAEKWRSLKGRDFINWVNGGCR